VKLLAVDIGNTNVTLGLFDGRALTGSWRASSRASATADELAAMTTGLLGLDGRTLADLDAVAVASVVPPLTASFNEFLDARVGLQPMVIDAATLEPVLRIEIDRPSEAGADRLANALAAR